MLRFLLPEQRLSSVLLFPGLAHAHCQTVRSCIGVHEGVMSTAHVQQLREAEGHDFGHAQLAAAVEGDIEVDVHGAAAPRLQQHIVQVPVAQAQQVAHLPGRNSASRLQFAGL